nr:TPA_inf: a1.2 [Testicularia cyperi]
MFSIFAQTAQTSVAETQTGPIDAAKNDTVGIGYSSCIVA